MSPEHNIDTPPSPDDLEKKLNILKEEVTSYGVESVALLLLLNRLIESIKIESDLENRSRLFENVEEITKFSMEASITLTRLASGFAEAASLQAKISTVENNINTIGHLRTEIKKLKARNLH